MTVLDIARAAALEALRRLNAAITKANEESPIIGLEYVPAGVPVWTCFDTKGRRVAMWAATEHVWIYDADKPGESAWIMLQGTSHDRGLNNEKVEKK